LKLNCTLGLRPATRLAKPRRTPKKNAPCFLDFARARFSFQKGKGVFSSVFCPQGLGQVAGRNVDSVLQKLFSGKGFAKPRLMFLKFGGVWISAPQEGAGGMRGGFFFGKERMGVLL